MFEILGHLPYLYFNQCLLLLDGHPNLYEVKFQGQLIQKVKKQVIIFACDTPPRPDPQFYQISKYFKTYGSYGAHKQYQKTTH